MGMGELISSLHLSCRSTGCRVFAVCLQDTEHQRACCSTIPFSGLTILSIIFIGTWHGFSAFLAQDSASAAPHSQGLLDLCDC